jgi:hypothetical protein
MGEFIGLVTFIVSVSETLEKAAHALESSTAAKSLGPDFADALTNLQSLSTMLVDSRNVFVYGVADGLDTKAFMDQLELLSADLKKVASNINELHTGKAYWKHKRIARLRVFKDRLRSISNISSRYFRFIRQSSRPNTLNVCQLHMPHCGW